MSKQLTWSEIQKLYKGCWVELTEFDWDWGSPAPRWAVVRHSEPSRSALLAKVGADSPKQSAVVMLVQQHLPSFRSPQAEAIC